MDNFKPEHFLILVVDDLRHNLYLLMDILEKVGYATTFANSGAAAIERVKSVKPDLILLDLMMPGMNGLEVGEHLKDELSQGETKVIFLTASDNEQDVIKAFEHGAIDYITKPYKQRELLARIQTHLELKHTRDQLKKSLETQSNLVKQLEKSVNTDTLTGFPNRRYMISLIDKQFARARREGVIFSILIVDLDRFKRINDTFGHFIGDEVIQTTAKIAKKSLRARDTLGRFGGEEFIVLLPETDSQEASEVAERLRRYVAATSLSVEKKILKVTVSVGVAYYTVVDTTINDILIRADRSLYEAKEQGRDRVAMIFPSDPEEG